MIDEDGNKNVNHHVIQRDRLRVDSRKWALSKMNPKKYSDKLDLTNNGKSFDNVNKVDVIFKDFSDEDNSE